MKSTLGYKHYPELSIFETELNNLLKKDIDSSQALIFQEQSDFESIRVLKSLSSSGNSFFHAPLSNISSRVKKEAESLSATNYTSE